MGGNGLCQASQGNIADLRGMVDSKTVCMQLCAARAACIGVTGTDFVTGARTHCELEAGSISTLDNDIPSGFSSPWRIGPVLLSSGGVRCSFVHASISP